MRVGLIGTGRHGSRYARHIVQDLPGLRLAALSRRSEERLLQARQWQCSAYADWQDLVADECVEAVIAVVPPVLNLAIAQACARVGKPLLVEKPLAASLAEARALVSLCRSEGLVVTVGQTLRYNQVVRQFRHRLPEMGSLYSFSANQRLEPSSLAWHDRPDLAGAGVSFHTAIHVFDALRFITGREVQRVMALCGQRQDALLEDLLLVLVEMEGGVKGTVDCSKVGGARSGRFEFVCSQGQLVGDQVYNSCARVLGLDVKPVPCGEPVGTILPLLKDWHDFVAGRKDNPIPVEEGFRAVRICAACLESARRASWVDVEEFV